MMKRDNIFDRYERAVRGMDIPPVRRAGSCENARWFLRNGAVTNRRHPNFQEAISIARDIARLSS